MSIASSLPTFGLLVFASAIAWGPRAAAQDGSVLDEEGLDDAFLDDAFLDDEIDALLDGEDVGGAESVEANPLRSWKGFVELRPRVYLRDRGGDKNDEQLLFESELEFEFRFRDDLSGYFRPRVFLDALDGDLQRFEPLEAYLTYEAETWDLRAGQFVENWGVVDTYNPLDVINRRDLATDPLDPTRLGELGFRLRRTFEGGDTVGEPTVLLYALPVFRETLFAPEDQRQGFDSATQPFDENGGRQPEGFDRGLYAARFQSTLTSDVAGADLSVIASRGPSRTPFVSDLAGTLVPAYYGAATFGAGLRAVPNEEAAGSFLSALTLKAEVVYTGPYSLEGSPIETPDDYIAYVLGIDRSFYGVLSDQDELTFTIEYAGESGADDAAAFFRPFRDDLIFRGLFEANDFARQSLEARAIVDLDVDENIFELLYERQLRSVHEDLKLITQLQVFDRAEPGESFYGSLEDLTSLAVGLRFDF